MDDETKTWLIAFEGRQSDKLLKLEAQITGLDAGMTGLDAKMTSFDAQLTSLEARLTEKIRDAQTELLRGFHAFSEAEGLRLQKLEADHSNLDASVSGRMGVLERRLGEIEMRLVRLGV